MTKWLGWVLTALPVLFLAFDTLVKVLAMPVAIEPTVALGYAANLVVPIGIIQLLCLVLYVVPRTAVLGAVLLTGYLGGAVATQLRAGNGAGQYLFPIVVGGWFGAHSGCVIAECVPSWRRRSAKLYSRVRLK
jgi:DoxX-like family